MTLHRASTRLLICGIIGLSGSITANEDPALFNGFNVNDGAIAAEDIYYNTEERDEIPSIDTPRFLAGSARDGMLGLNKRVLAVAYNGVSKAYPIDILDLHEIVNDDFDGKPVAVTFCPLCGTGMVFASEVRGKRAVFGVSGLIYNNNLLFYDHDTESLWSQIMMQAVTGPLQGTSLKRLPSHHTTWGHWLQTHPDSLLLSRDTGYSFDYDLDMYYDYRRLPVISFPTVHHDLRFDGKDLVVGISLGEHALALPITQLDKLNGPLSIALGDTVLNIEWDKESATAAVADQQGNEIQSVEAYWFAWVAFHPQTSVYNPPH
jgi:hypothetical protein